LRRRKNYFVLAITPSTAVNWPVVTSLAFLGKIPALLPSTLALS
jgi:hypothetical protein